MDAQNSRHDQEHSRQSDTENAIAGRDDPTREAFLLSMLPIIHKLASQKRLYQHPVLHYEDLVHEGMVGLLAGLRKFDLAKSPPIPYAYACIQHGMQEAFRRFDIAKRNLRKRSGPLIEQELRASLVRTVHRAARQQQQSMQSEAAVINQQQSAALRCALATLPPRWRQVLTYYYDDDPLSMAAIGILLGVGETRIFQIKAKALAALRRQVAGGILSD